ncbi:MAG TPA: RNA methyltransferase [Anaerolineales bacterium]|nr:RNA methyltransferase [Anaerolineales bacterium]
MITSSQNPKLKRVRSLMGRAKERRDANAFVVEGVRLIEEAVNADWEFQFALYSDGLSQRGMDLVDKLSARDIEIDDVAGDLIQKLSDTENPQGILAVLKTKSLPMPASPNFVLIPDQIRDPGNLGTLLRTAVATGVQAILLPPETTDVFAPKIVRAGMGAHYRLPIRSMKWEEIKSLTQDMHIHLADMDGTPCWEADLHTPLALIIGGEAEGASDEARRLATQKICIPMAGNVESLNAGVAGSVLMFEVMRQRNYKKLVVE